jgi:hypothetical protein
VKKWNIYKQKFIYIIIHKVKGNLAISDSIHRQIGGHYANWNKLDAKKINTVDSYIYVESKIVYS